MSRFLWIGILKSFKKEYGCQNNAEFYADFETVEKNAKTLLTKKLKTKKGAKLGIFLFYTTN